MKYRMYVLVFRVGLVLRAKRPSRKTSRKIVIMKMFCPYPDIKNFGRKLCFMDTNFILSWERNR